MNAVYRCCGNCRFYLFHHFLDDECTHPLVPEWFHIGDPNKICPLHKFIVEDDGETVEQGESDAD